ncbi:hypothetical protein [Nautilia lithotrophica]
MKKGVFFLIFASFLFANSLKLIYSTSTNSLKTIDFQKKTLLYATIKNIYFYSLLTEKTIKKHIDNIIKAKLCDDAEKIIVLNKFDGVKIYDRNFNLLKKIVGNYKNFFFNKYLYLIKNEYIEIYDVFDFNFIKKEKIPNIESVDFKSTEYGDYILIATRDGIYIKDFNNFDRSFKIQIQSGMKIKKILFVNDSKFLIFANGKVYIYNLNGKKVQTIDLGYEKIKSVFVNDEKIYITNGSKIYVYEYFSKYKITQTYNIKPVDIIDIVSDNEYIVVGGKYNVFVYQMEDSSFTTEKTDTDVNITKSVNEYLKIDVLPRFGNAPLEVVLTFDYNFESDKIKSLKITFDNNTYDIVDKKIKEFNYVFEKPGIHKIEVFMQTDSKTFNKTIYVKVEKE